MLPHMSQIAVPIDGDNISAKCFPFIHERLSSIARLSYCFVSAKEAAMTGWDKASTVYPFKKFIAPDGQDIADSIIFRKCVELLDKHPEIDIFCIATNDSDYAPLGKMLRALGKRVIFFGTAQAAKILRKDFEFILLKKPITNNQSPKTNN